MSCLPSQSVRLCAAPGAGWLAAVLLAVVAPMARADIQAPPARGRGRANEPAVSARARPAGAVDAAAQVPLGGSAEIVLRARGQLGKAVDFLLRDPPVHGTLSEPRPTGRDTAVVTYTHRAADGPSPDGFTYAVQAAGTAVSATATVEVRVTDDPPRVVPVGDLETDFGAVPPGGEAHRELTLENRGGGLATGVIEVPAPWSVEGGPGAAGYRLARDERQTFTLVFRPNAARTFTGSIAFGRTAEDQTTARLAGVGLRADGSLPPTFPAPGLSEDDHRGGALASANAPPSRPAPAPTPVRNPVLPAVPPAPPPAGGSGDEERAASAGPPSLPYAPLETSLLPREGDSPVKSLALQSRGSHVLTVAWPSPRPLPAGYRVELRRFWIDKEKVLQSRWDNYPSVAFRPGPDNTVQATLRALPAGINQTLRVVAVDGRGVLSPPSAPLQAATLPTGRWWSFVSPLWVLLAGLGTCLFLLWRRARLAASTGW